jgi:hypothetical protein
MGKSSSRVTSSKPKRSGASGKKRAKKKSAPTEQAPKALGYSRFIARWKASQPIADRIARFIPALSSESEAAGHAHGLIRGHELLRNAKAWTRPEIGTGRSAGYRGHQWRLVMAYNGMELLIKSLLQKAETRGLEEEDLTRVLGRIALPGFEPLHPPSLARKYLAKWIAELEQDAVLNFLKTERGDKTRLRAWLIDQQPIVGWHEAILLTKALRNCTAHGALSPKKVEQWGLKPAFVELPQKLFRIDEAIFEILGE